MWISFYQHIFASLNFSEFNKETTPNFQGCKTVTACYNKSYKYELKIKQAPKSWRGVLR